VSAPLQSQMDLEITNKKSKTLVTSLASKNSTMNSITPTAS